MLWGDAAICWMGAFAGRSGGVTFCHVAPSAVRWMRPFEVPTQTAPERMGEGPIAVIPVTMPRPPRPPAAGAGSAGSLPDRRRGDRPKRTCAAEYWRIGSRRCEEAIRCRSGAW